MFSVIRLNSMLSIAHLLTAHTHTHTHIHTVLPVLFLLLFFCLQFQQQLQQCRRVRQREWTTVQSLSLPIDFCLATSDWASFAASSIAWRTSLARALISIVHEWSAARAKRRTKAGTTVAAALSTNKRNN